MTNAFLQLTLTKLREYIREPESMFWVFVFPVLMTCVMGIAFRDSSSGRVHAGVVTDPRASAAYQTAATRLLQRLGADPRIDVRSVSADEAASLLRDGELSVVVIPSDDGRGVTYRFDRTRPESSVARFTVDDVLQRSAGRADAFTPDEELVELPGSRYIDWLVPGLLGMNVMITGIWGIAFSVGMSRAKKLIKRLSATPMRRGEYLASQVAGRLIFLPLEAGLLIVFARYAFDVPMHGSWMLLTAIILLGALSGAALALLCASRARSFEAVSGFINLAVVPMWILSGVFFSSAHFPEAVQPFVQALPLTALNDALRAVMLAGDGLTAVAHEMVILTAWTAVCFLLTLKIFRWH